MIKTLLLLFISHSAFAVPLNQCTLDYYKNTRSSSAIVIDNSRTEGEKALNTFRSLNSEIYPYYDELQILRGEKKEAQEILEKAIGHDQCGDPFDITIGIETICIRGVNSDVTCEQRCRYINHMDPDCNY